MIAKKIKSRERDAIIQALSAGVVPRIGIQHIAVGRSKETDAMIKDIEKIANKASAIRFIIGEYGAGKTFFLNLVRQISLEKQLVVVSADLAPDRRIHATAGQARNLYSELMRNLSTRSKPDGGALQSIIERFISDTSRKAKKEEVNVSEAIHSKLLPLEEFVAGFDFATVLEAYWKRFNDGDDMLKGHALRWLRGEYSTKTEARKDLGLRSIIDDASVYDHLKLMARFVQIAGYAGLMVTLDEMVNLYKLNNAQARNANYEQLLRIINDVLQGTSSGIGFVFGGTSDFLMDTRRGIYSYEALQSRLAENQFAKNNLVDLSGPVVRLQSLKPEEFYILLANIRHVFALGNESDYLIPDKALEAFMVYCNEKIGEAYFRTPRSTAKAFVNLLAVLEQNPTATWDMLIADTAIEADKPVDKNIPEDIESDEELATFKL
ncbi:MAG: ATP-binding protein [Bacteroidota bacterium]